MQLKTYGHSGGLLTLLHVCVLQNGGSDSSRAHVSESLAQCKFFWGQF